MVWHWIPVLVLAWVWIALFAVNTLHQQASLSRYSEWAAQRERSWWRRPGIL